MKAMVIEEFGGADKLKLKEVPKPHVQDHEVLIKVAYAGVNPVDWKIREGFLHARKIPHGFPLIMGWDASGTIEAVGKKVVNLKVGDAVFSCVKKPLIQWGSYAEYVAFDAKDVVKKPKNVSFTVAAAIPLVSVTAWQALFDAVHLKKGESILIHAGSGGVGSIAIQLAKIAGAKIITTASGEKESFVRDLGADIFIDYKKEDFAKRVQGVDIVFDTVGGDTFKKSLDCLKKGGRIVSLIERLDLEEAKKRGIEAYYVFVNPNGEELMKIAKLIEEGKIALPEVEEMPLADAGIAQDKQHAGKVLGKLVLKIQ